MPKQANPGVPEGTEVIYLGRPFGGWAQTLAGPSPATHYTASVEGTQGALNKQQANNYAESDGITLFRREKIGQIAPAQVFSSMTNAAITDLPLNGGLTSTSFFAICVLNNGRLIRVDTSTNTYDSDYDPTSHTPIASSGANNDLIIFTDLASTPIEYAIYSWEYSGGAEVSIIKTSDFPSTHTDGWYSGLSNAVALKANVPHKLCAGPDGNIYVTDGNIVQQIVVTGAIASASVTAGTANRLNVGAGWTCTGICSYKNYVAIIASSRTSSANRAITRVFLWSGKATTVNGVTSIAPEFIFDVPDNYGNGIYFDGSTLYILTNGRNNSSKIFEFTGKEFKKVFESPLIAPSPSPIQGSMEVYQDALMIGGTKNSTARLFRLYVGGFHDEGQLTDGTNAATSVGMVKNFYTDTLLIGVKYGSTYALFNGTNSNYQTGSVLRTILYTEGILGRRLYPLGFKGSLNRFQIFLSQWGTGASLTLSVFKDYATMGGAGTANDLLNLLLDTDTNTANGPHHKAYPVGTTEIDITDIAIPNISSFYMLISFTHASVTNTAAIIRDMVVHWTPSQ